jgi:hypothetical protein
MLYKALDISSTNVLGYMKADCWINPLKPELIQIIFKDSLRTPKKTQHFSTAKIKLFPLFKEIIAVYIENRTKPVSTNYRIF